MAKKAQPYASPVVIAEISAARDKLSKKLMDKTNLVSGNDPAHDDFSLPIVMPLFHAINSVIIYFEAMAAGHADKRSVKTLRKQLEALADLACDPVSKLLPEAPAPEKAKPKKAKAKAPAPKFKLVQ